MENFFVRLSKFIKDEDGLTTAEWVILASAVTVAAIAVVGLIMPKIREMAETIEGDLSTQPYTPE